MMDTPPKNDDPLLFRGVIAVNAVLAFAAASLVTTFAVLATATAAGDQLKQLKNRFRKESQP
jgi:hypothetical protein